MTNDFSKGVESVEISGIRKFSNKAAKYKDAISLTLGQPDFPVPKDIKDAMIKAINDNKTGYTSNIGILELREEISKYLKGFDINYKSSEICITIGGSEALFSLFCALINKGDEVLVPTPAYPAYESCVKIFGGNVINYNLNNNDFSINFEELEAIIKNNNIKIIVLSYPCNPTGAVLSKKDCERLHKIIKENNIIAVSDEIYCALCYEDNYYSVGQYEDIKDKVIIVGGFSKMFSMTGLRIGYVCAEENIMDSIMKPHQYSVSCAPSISQYGALSGLKYSKSDVIVMKSEFMKRRDYVYNRLKGFGMDCAYPKGAFYIFPEIKKFGLKSEEFCDRLLKEKGVAVIPGSAFGKNGEGHIRISYSYSIEELEMALDKICEWIKNI